MADAASLRLRAAPTRKPAILPTTAPYERVAPDVADACRALGAATVHECQGRSGALSAALKPLAPRDRVCGPAYTLRLAPGDNLGLHFAIVAAQRGDVLVIDAGDAIEHGPFGELLALTAQVRGLGGLVTSGSVRDAEAIAALGFAVFCKGVSIKGTAKQVLPDVARPIAIDGVAIRPGDLVVGDADGVVVVPREHAAAVVAKAQARAASEAAAMARIRAGATPWEMLGLDQVLQALSDDPRKSPN